MIPNNNPKPPIKVSVVICTYNHALFIAEAIDSALMQETNFPYEIILGEDESQDGTREICIEYANKYPDRIRLFLRSREDVIYINGRPTGRYNFIENLKAASGEYVALLDGDDFWTDPLKLQKQVEFLENNQECVICFHDVTFSYGIGERQSNIYSLPDEKTTYTMDDLLIKSNFIPTCSTMFVNGLFGKYPQWFYEITPGDWPLHILNAQYGKIGYLKEDMAVYRVHSTGIYSGLDEILRRESSLHAREVIYKNLVIESNIHLLGEYIFRNAFLLASKYYYRKNDVIRSRMYLAKCFRYIRYNATIPWKAFIKLCIEVWVPKVYKSYRIVKQILIMLRGKLARHRGSQS